MTRLFTHYQNLSTAESRNVESSTLRGPVILLFKVYMLFMLPSNMYMDISSSNLPAIKRSPNFFMVSVSCWNDINPRMQKLCDTHMSFLYPSYYPIESFDCLIYMKESVALALCQKPVNMETVCRQYLNYISIHVRGWGWIKSNVITALKSKPCLLFLAEGHVRNCNWCKTRTTIFREQHKNLFLCQAL